ncbi:arginine N-succinyltransferase [Burkholderia sp. 3C]
MMTVRMARPGDAGALLALARTTGVGMTSFMPDAALIEARIARSVATLAGSLPPAQQGYLFVLEDTCNGCVAGVSGIEAAVGLDAPWYNYRIGRFIHASKETGVSSDASALFLSNDHTGHSELCTLFLAPDYRRDGNGALLSKARFMFIAAFRERFARSLVAEMRGVTDAAGRSPFWDAVCRPFFQMEFPAADRWVGLGRKSIIAELMPKHPLYLALLPAEARAVIGAVHPHTAPARALLESEGLRFSQYVDIFDGGATLQGEIDRLRIVADSTHRPLDAALTARHGPQLLANDALHGFRVVIGSADGDPARLGDALQCERHAPVRCAALRATPSNGAGHAPARRAA